MSIRNSAAFTFSFPMIDTLNRPNRKSGLSIGTGDTWISKDGGSYANTTNAPTEIGTTGRYALTLTAAEMSASWVHIYVVKSGADEMDQGFGTSGNPTGTVVTDGSNTPTTFKTDLSSSTTDFWKDCLLLFTSGTLAGQVKKVTAYNGTTKFVTVSSGGYTGTPSNTDRFILVNL